MNSYSPLRYPGGKANLASYIKRIIQNMNISECSYFELYAGGAGAALDLLYTNTVKKIILNDADYHIFSFWKSILENTEEFIRLIEKTSIDINSWYIQREIYSGTKSRHSMLEVGFSTFFLNRCNRSGIINKAGPIGGLQQKGKYKIDCRFHKNSLIKKIESIANRADDIEIYNEDTLDFIKQNYQRLSGENAFMYLDPPYYNKGKSLYLNFYTHNDHENLRNLLSSLRDINWMISYDNVSEINDLYLGFNSCLHTLNYSLQNKRKTNEFFVFSDTIIL